MIKGYEPALLRMRLNRLLNTVDWRPSGMPPTAVFIVRHLSDPLPGQLAPQPGAIRSSPKWETAVKKQMTTLYRTAARPNRGQLPANATAVLFADEAEMLACLALDMACGLAADRWWWRALRRARPTLQTRSMVRLLSEQPLLTPAVFACLHDWDSLITVTATLTTAQVVTVLTAVTQAYHLPPITQFTAAASQSPLPSSDPLPEITAVPPPWKTILPLTAVPETLAPIHACLVGLSLSLVRRPTAVHTPTFMRQLQAWGQAQMVIHRRLSPAPRSVPEQAAPSLPTQTQPAASQPISVPTAPPPSPQTKSEFGVTQKSPSDSTAPALPLPASSPLAAREIDHDVKAVSAAAPPTEIVTDNDSDQTSIAPEPKKAIFPTTGVNTQLGGIFYLINLMTQLDLPACFEETWELASQVGAWGILELLARALLCREHGRLNADPIWEVLAELDGRSPSQRPGHDYIPPKRSPKSVIRLPKAFVNNGLRLTNNGLRLTDNSLPLTDNGLRLTKSPPWLNNIHPDLLRWLALVLPAIRRHLLTVLRLDEGSHLAEVLLLVNGRLIMTTSHVDLIMSLDDISLPVRLAGLDFDPGWQPSFGRVIQFHFE